MLEDILEDEILDEILEEELEATTTPSPGKAEHDREEL